MGGLVPKVVHVFPAIRRGGGPSGYAFNLVQALAEVREAKGTIELLFPPKSTGSNPGKPSRTFQILRELPPWVAGPLLTMRTFSILRDAFRYFGFLPDQIYKIKQAQVVVFHDFRLASAYIRDRRRNPTQKVFVMSHSPTDLSSELLENWKGYWGESRLWPSIRRMLMRIELRTLLSCDGLLVPCRAALQSYFEGMPQSQALINSLPIYEIKSGVPKLVPTRERREVLSKWGLPLEKKIVGYFGRRHPHKGYDLFCQAAVMAHEKRYEDLFFVAAGGGHLPSPTHLPNFRDLGYLTEELADVVNAVDLVIVPNRVSYFDFFILEAMSLGKPVLTSRVGGNVCIDSPGVFFLDKLDSETILVAMVELLSNGAELEKKGKANELVYEQLYGLRSFGKRHLDLAQSLLFEG